MAEWIKTAEIARRAGYSVSAVQAMIQGGVIPREYIAHNGKGYILDSRVIPWLIERKRNWHAAQVAPAGTQYAADPNGEYLGFELTPDEAQRLLAIRELKRLCPTTQERNKAMRGDG